MTAGLHGANRLGGNSLVETLVFGRRAGEAAARWSRERESQLRFKPVIDEAHDDLDSLIHHGTELSRGLQRAIRNVMLEQCGVVRQASEMEQALAMLDEVHSVLPRVDVRPSLAVALVVWVSALVAGLESYAKLVSGAPTVHLEVGLAGATIGIFGNLAVAWYKGRVGQRIFSTALQVDARHSRLDAVSSVGAFVGILLVAAGQPLGDPIAGFAITLLIVRVGFEVTRDVLHHLLDGIEPELVARATSIAAQAAGVRTVRSVRGRWTGRALLFEMEVELDPSSTVADAATVAADIETAVRTDLEMTRRVVVALVPPSPPAPGLGAAGKIGT